MFDSLLHGTTDHNHAVIDDGTDFRHGNGLKDIAARVASYGDYAGVSNKMEMENAGAIQKRLVSDPTYDPYNDPAYAKYKPKDGLDAAARDHDHTYFTDLGFDNPLTGKKQVDMNSWEGLNKAAKADATIARDTQKEMDAHGDQYGTQTHIKADGLEGFFGSRARGVEAVDWTSNKLHEAEHGISGWAGEMSHAKSLSQVGHGLSTGAESAGSWMSSTAHEAAGGLHEAAADFSRLGTMGKIGSIAGYGQVGYEGLKHLAGADHSDAAPSAPSKLASLEKSAAAPFHGLF
jgi:hypothetical protein